MVCFDLIFTSAVAGIEQIKPVIRIASVYSPIFILCGTPSDGFIGAMLRSNILREEANGKVSAKVLILLRDAGAFPIIGSATITQ